MRPKRDQLALAIDESTESEITIQPDGRVFAFGITKPLAAVLATIPMSDERMKHRLDRIAGIAGASDVREPLDLKEND